MERSANCTILKSVYFFKVQHILANDHALWSQKYMWEDIPDHMFFKLSEDKR